MSVPKSKRSKPKCYAVINAKKVAEHTLNITANKNIFKCTSLAEDINHTAEQIYISVYNANNVFVNDHETYLRRIDYQRDAIIHTKSLLALIDLVWHIDHLKQRKVDYWVSLVIEARKTISGWHKADKERYKEYQ